MSEEISQPQVINESVETAPEAASNAEALSFDDLDNLTDGRSAAELMSEAKGESKKESEENKSESQSESSGEEVEAKQEESEATEEQIEEIKKLIAKYGDQELEIAANAIFKHKVDGEEVDVELQELLNNYSGKVSYDKKFQELSSQKKEFEGYKSGYDQEISQINGYIQDFANKLKNNDALGALQYFAEFAGMKPHEFRSNLLSQLTPEIERRSMMSPEELRAEQLSNENEYLLKQQESAQQRSQQEQALEDLKLEIANVQEAHGISDEDFSTAYNELLESEYEGEITPASVAEYYVHAAAFSKADEVLSSIDPVLADQDEVVESLQKIIVENPSFDDNDLMEIVQEVYGNVKKEASKSVSKKVSDNQVSKKQANTRSKEEFIDWDEL